jgi:hypothetical protein
MSATLVVVGVAVLLVVVFTGFWLWDRDPARLARRRSGVPVSRPVPERVPMSEGPVAFPSRPAAPLTTSDIAWAVCGGIWLFVITAGVVGVGVAVAVLVVVRSRG